MAIRRSKMARQYALDTFLPLNFSDLVLKLGNGDIQKVLREIDFHDIAKALKGQDESVQEKIFTNMSKRASKMLIEYMEYIGPLRIQDVEEGQKKLLTIISRLKECGEIADSQVPNDAESDYNTSQCT
jgi:flagellar motor switch protein FliG